ncbi:hypothetical protein SAMN04488511_105223 [Pedobacter suwonensis]|uniref:ParE toxin of type II toxin-antitoxin system, parDE n=1 Tax=Pedobacter suwonensis TaxID=332999 RepID=A0A1I0T4P4_9SPHI|nr:hypothetical protein [Pedobacter suwonensis]SFA46006.1 hypothetical protein SAMN04488511_105223 [Pedobacter suwonensis]
MEIVVRFHPSVLLYLNELVDVLFYENYFSIRESAIDYVTRLIDTVERKIGKAQYHIAPKVIAHRGSWFIHFNISQKTTWYFLFEKSGNHYLITYVFNNYSKEAQNLNL